MLNELKVVVDKFTGKYTLAIKNIERLPYYIGNLNYGNISETRMPYYNGTNGNYIYEAFNTETTDKYIFIPIKFIAKSMSTKCWYQL